MLNGVKKEDRIGRTLDGLCSDTFNLDVLRSLAEIALRGMSEEDMKGWWELKEDIE